MNTFQTVGIVFCVLTALSLYLSVHTINEGYVGVIYQFGSLSERMLEPGLNLVVPFITSVYQVQITIQTDYIKNVPCGTSSGVTIVFGTIEVVNQLNKAHVYETVKNYTVDYDKTQIFDRITHEMNQFCSKRSLQQVYIDEFDTLDEILMETLQHSLNMYSPGVPIRNVRLSKPSVPAEVENNYKNIVVFQTEMLKAKTQQEKDMLQIRTENEKALEKLNSEREQTLAKIKSEQGKKLAEIELNKNYELAQTEALREKEIARIKGEEQRKLAEIMMTTEVNQKTIERDLAHKEGLIKVQELENQIDKSKRTAEIDVRHYENMKYAEYQNQLLTPGYVAIEVSKSVSNNTKIFYGDKLPQFFNIPGFNMGSVFNN